MLLCAWWRHEMETFSALLALCAGSGWVTNRQAGNLRRHCAHYDGTVMDNPSTSKTTLKNMSKWTTLFPYVWYPHLNKTQQTRGYVPWDKLHSHSHPCVNLCETWSYHDSAPDTFPHDFLWDRGYHIFLNWGHFNIWQALSQDPIYSSKRQICVSCFVAARHLTRLQNNMDI